MLQQLKDLAVELAEVELARVRASMPQDLVERLAAIAGPALPAGPEETTA